MSIAVREFPHSRAQIHRSTGILAAKPSMGTLILALIVMFSALAVVYMADVNRRLFIDLQTAQATEMQLHTEWGKLLLEQSTWSTQARIQSIAVQNLGMEVPATDKVVMLKMDS